MSAVQPAAGRMSIARARKVRMAEDFAQLVDGCEAVLAAQCDGLSVAAMEQLRASAREAGGRVKVVKKTVAGRVLAANSEFAPLAGQLAGQLLFAAAPSAPALAKALRDFASENEGLRIAGGAMQGSYLTVQQCAVLAALPTREELLAKLAGTLAAPAAKLARTLAAGPAGFARALAAVCDSRGESSGTSGPSGS